MRSGSRSRPKRRMSEGEQGIVRGIFILAKQVKLMGDEEPSYFEGVTKYYPYKIILIPIVLLIIGILLAVGSLVLIIKFPLLLFNGTFLALLIPGIGMIALAIYYRKKVGSWTHFEW